MAWRPLLRKSDIGAPPARFSGGAPPSLSVAAMSRRPIRGRPLGSLGCRKRTEMESNFGNSDSESPSTSQNGDVDSEDEIKSRKLANVEKFQKSRKKRYFRLSASVETVSPKAEASVQLEAPFMDHEEKPKYICEGKVDELKPDSSKPVPCEKSVGSSYSPMQILCDYLLRQLLAKDPEEYFTFPVTASIAPDYHEIIKEPMDFLSMRTKVEADEYPNITEFQLDVKLIISNALIYNEPNTPYYLSAQKLEAIADSYFSEHYLRYLCNTLSFCKDIPSEKMGLAQRASLVPKVQRSVVVHDTIASTMNDSCNYDIYSVVPDSRVLPNCESGLEPRCRLAYLENKNGDINVSVIDSITSERLSVPIGDLIGELDEESPLICASTDPEIYSQKPKSLPSNDPFKSFVQFDKFWTDLCEKNRKLLLSAYSDRKNVAAAMSMRRFVEDADETIIEMVDDVLDSLSNGEHRKTMASLRSGDNFKICDVAGNDAYAEEILNEMETLENIGIDTSFVADVRKIYKQKNASNDFNDLSNGARSVSASNRSSTIQLGSCVTRGVSGEVLSEMMQFPNSEDAVPSEIIQNSMCSNYVDMDLLKEFFTPATRSLS